MDYPQGDVRLLQTDIARRLLNSTIPARVAYTATDGTPRVMSSWFVWTGDELVMATYLYCPPIGVLRPAYRVKALRERPDVAITIDTEPQPPEVLLLRGRVSITEVKGMVPEQAEAARRFLGEEGGAGYVAAADHPETLMARMALRPTWVGVLDFQTRLPDLITT
ncbi:pyridoxamine 5'-phosphate oxidase [Actinomadura spongiicola]|uniref:Pyridoxamine 5'-phosphate oxidase n=1 Tax=Actinomadura spongiicola TaxID=2303421 RepID=A0A372GE59_9ACTN|nr:pyridoxamine 5'-phosphate oxidase [Actinomadura spongiicola]RFS83655.1 pyridoxamine 5'-phosphate oxidase [Actinomadura spongiicola]